MYEITHKQLHASCEVIEQSSESDWEDRNGETVTHTSQYLTTFRHSDEGGGHFELIIQMEGNPGPACALYQAARHIHWCTSWPLDMLARGNIQDLPILVTRLTEIRTMVVIACHCGPNLIEELMGLIPAWDLPNGRYAILMTNDKTEYGEDEDDDDEDDDEDDDGEFL